MRLSLLSILFIVLLYHNNDDVAMSAGFYHPVFSFCAIVRFSAIFLKLPFID